MGCVHRQVSDVSVEQSNRIASFSFFKGCSALETHMKTLRRTYHSFLVLAGTAIMSGCTSTHVHWNATKLREAAIEYYSDQVMDNLIRARNGELFLHVNLTLLTAQVTSKVAGNVGAGETTTDTITRGPAGLISAAATTVKPFSWSVTPERSDVLTLTAVPEINDSPMYELYIQFLNLPPPSTYTNAAGNVPLESAYASGVDVANQSRICSVESHPTRSPKVGEYVPGTLKKRRGQVYYVPIAYKQAYFDLCVSLVSRIKSKQPSPDASANAATTNLYLLPKYDSPELRLLQRLEQKIESR